MKTIQVPIYSQDEKKILRLNTCKKCIFSECKGNRDNKCDVDSLVCTKDSNMNIMKKVNDVLQDCKMGYWKTLNETKTVIDNKKGCGCGK